MVDYVISDMMASQVARSLPAMNQSSRRAAELNEVEQTAAAQNRLLNEQTNKEQTDLVIRYGPEAVRTSPTVALVQESLAEENRARNARDEQQTREARAQDAVDARNRQQEMTNLMRAEDRAQTDDQITQAALTSRDAERAAMAERRDEIRQSSEQRAVVTEPETNQTFDDPTLSMADTGVDPQRSAQVESYRDIQQLTNQIRADLASDPAEFEAQREALLNGLEDARRPPASLQNAETADNEATETDLATNSGNVTAATITPPRQGEATDNSAEARRFITDPEGQEVAPPLTNTGFLEDPFADDMSTIRPYETSSEERLREQTEEGERQALTSRSQEAAAEVDRADDRRMAELAGFIIPEGSEVSRAGLLEIQAAEAEKAEIMSATAPPESSARVDGNLDGQMFRDIGLLIDRYA